MVEIIYGNLQPKHSRAPVQFSVAVARKTRILFRKLNVTRPRELIIDVIRILTRAAPCLMRSEFGAARAFGDSICESRVMNEATETAARLSAAAHRKGSPVRS
jgi:hypothetical protein